MQANKKLLEMVWLVSVVGRVEGVLVPGGEEGVVGPGLDCSGLAEDTSAEGWRMVLVSGVVPSVSTDLVTEYISLPTTSRLNSLFEDFSLCAYLGRKENINIV